jgi:hypothetical protein
LEDNELAELLLEYGFLSKEQLESVLEKQKRNADKRTLEQVLVQEDVVSERALKTLNSVRRRKREARLQAQEMRRKFKARDQRTRSFIKTDAPEVQKPVKEKPADEDFWLKKESAEGDDFVPVTLTGLKEDIEHLKQEVANLKSVLKDEIISELEDRLKGEREKQKD